ncbi:MAG: peptidoglycan-binding protein, partial [Phycisphaerae bacterium]|nr:peptidoglycan-binding protein [Phycisphaerae bacterium]
TPEDHMGLKTVTGKINTQSPWAIAIALAVALLIIEGLAAVVWSGTRPQSIPLQDYNDLQTDLTSQLKTKETALADAAQKLQTAESHNERLQRDVTSLRQKVARLISPEQLPVQARGATPSQTLNKIQDLCDAVQQVNQANVSALLAVLVEIQKNSVINTALETKDPARETLYHQIQTILNQIDAYAGPIQSDQPSTLAAVKDYQTQNHLKVDGKIGINTFMTMVQSFQEKRLRQSTPPTS